MEQQRKKYFILIAAVSILTFGWITIGTGAEEVPYVSIAELMEQQEYWTQTRYRLGGLVADGSIETSDDRLTTRFVMEQEGERLMVTFTGLTPDMFGDDAEVIVEGRYSDGLFMADNLMTKCASRYEVDPTEQTIEASYEDL